jgi:tetratricopeptide (TPR) repeat protein
MQSDDRTLTSFGTDQQLLPQRAGKYRIVGRIGQGGMGVVYRAVDDDLGRMVALKFIPPHLAADPVMEQRFLREARAASALDHVNIGTIFGVEETDGRRFIVMAYYEGQNLSQRTADAERPIDIPESIAIATQIARGLAEAHARGVVHRDIKPSNILITPQGVVKIVDFGLANIAGGDQLTLAGTRMGTPAYMSPEQALGESVDHRSDIWSLGVILCELLTGIQAFDSNSVPAILFKVVHGALPCVDNLDPTLQPILRKALDRDPARRYQTMDELLAALESLPPGLAPSSAPTRLVQPLPAAGPGPSRFASHLRPVIIGVLATAAVLFAGLYLTSRFFSPRPPGAATATSGAYEKYLRGVELAKRWDKGDNLDQAIALFTESTKVDPRFALAFARLADAQRIRYALSRDKAHLDQAAANAQHAASLNSELAPVQVALGRIHAMRGNNDLAYASFETAMRIDPNDPEANQAIARQYERLGRLKDTETAYKRALSLDPDSISIHDAYANFLFRQSRHKEAIREWQDVIRLAPDNAPAYVNLGSSLSETGNIAEAISMYQRAVELKPSYMAFSNLGTAYSRAKRYPDAVAAYQKAMKLNDRDHMVWGNLAFVYSWMGGAMLPKAAETFGRAIQMAEAKRKDSPRDAYVYSDLALYYAKTGKPQLSAQRLDTALALSPKNPEIQAAAAEASLLLGHRDKAAAFALNALKTGYSNQRLRRNPELAGLLSDPRFRTLQ